MNSPTAELKEAAQRLAQWGHWREAGLFTGFLLLALGVFLALVAYLTPPYVERPVLEYSFTINSAFDGYVSLVPNPVFGNSTPLRGLPTYATVARELYVTHSLSTTGGVFKGAVKYSVYLAHPDGWRVAYIPNATLPIVVNITKAAEYMDQLGKTLGVSAGDFSIVVAVEISGAVSAGPYTREVYKTHAVALAVSRSRNKVELVGNLTTSENYNSTRVDRRPVTIYGRPVEDVRTAAVGIAAAGATVAIAATSLSPRRKTPEEEAEEKLKTLTIETAEVDIPTAALIRVKTPEGLAKAAKMLEKPIIKITGSKPRYYVIDRDTAYYYEP